MHLLRSTKKNLNVYRTQRDFIWHPVLTSYIPCSLCPWYQTYRALINTITCLPNWLRFLPPAYTNLTSMEPVCFITPHPYLPHTHPHSHTRTQTISSRPSYIPSLPWNKSSTLTSRNSINWKPNETSKNDIVIFFFWNLTSALPLTLVQGDITFNNMLQGVSMPPFFYSKPLSWNSWTPGMGWNIVLRSRWTPDQRRTNIYRIGMSTDVPKCQPYNSWSFMLPLEHHRRPWLLRRRYQFTEKQAFAFMNY